MSKLIDKLIKKDNNFAGYVRTENTGGMFGLRVVATAITSLKEADVLKLIKAETKASDVQFNYINAAPFDQHEDKQGDEVRTLFMGMLPTAVIQDNTKFKIENPTDMTNIKEWYREFRYLSPIVLSRDLSVIDGHIRLKIAQNSTTEYVPVVVLDTNEIKSDALRLGLNRSSEFSRWEYNEVDPFVDSKPQLQPILEPIGFFSNNILPTSFFSNTVMSYKYDELNEQMKQYMQDDSLIEWAQLMRDRQVSLDKERAAKENDYSRHSGLLNIEYTDDDLLNTYNADEVSKHTLDDVTKLADTITKKFDAKRKPEIEKKGLQWQRTKLSSKQLVAKKHAEAEADNDEEE